MSPDPPGQGDVQLELAAIRQTCRALYNDLMVAMRAVTLIQAEPAVSANVRDLAEQADASLAEASRRLAAIVEDVQPRRRAREVDPSRPTASVPLSPREREVLALIVEGLSNRRIAERLGVGTATAKSHVQRLLAKLHVANRTQAAMLATRLGLLEPPM